MKNSLVDSIRTRKIEKQQSKNRKNLVKDAYFIANENQEFWVGYLDSNGDYAQKKLDFHNYYLAFHNSIWKSLEPNEKLAALIYLERDLVINSSDKFTPKNEGKFNVVSGEQEDYFCSREKGQNLYNINMRLFADEFLESYSFVYALYYMHIEAKGLELMEEFDDINNLEPDYKDVVLNLKNRRVATYANEKFLLGEELTNEEAVEVLEYFTQPIEKEAKINLAKIEGIAFRASNFATGLGFEDLEWKYYLEDQKLLERDKEELIKKTYSGETNKLNPNDEVIK